MTEVALRGWYINDRGYQIYDGDTNRPVAAAPPRGRYYFPYKHNTTILKGGNPVDADRAPAFDTPALTSRSHLNVLSDAYVTQDFFPEEYMRDQQPNTYLDAMYQDPNFTVTANARTQINNLFQTQQQKPSAKIEFKRQYIPGTYDEEELLKDPNYRILIFFYICLAVSSALGLAFAVPFARDVLKASESDISYMGMVFFIAGMLVVPVIGRISDSFGYRISGVFLSLILLSGFLTVLLAHGMFFLLLL